MLVGKFKERMTNYYVVSVGRKRGVCNSWINIKKTISSKESIRDNFYFLFFV